VRVFADERFEFTEPTPQTVVLTSQRAAGRSLTFELGMQVIELRPQAVDQLLLLVRGGWSTQGMSAEGLLEEADDGHRAL
jgi:hypothetical protein